jgi:dihydroorotate dehydrogenase
MKKLMLIILLFIAGTAFSQETQTTKQQRNPAKIATAEFEMLKKRITDLSETQKSYLQTVYTDYAKDLTAIQERPNKKGKLKAFEKANADRSDKAKNILTTQQWPVYVKLNDELKQKMMERRKKK